MTVRDSIKDLESKADAELDSAVENNEQDQAMYWLGKKRAYSEILRRYNPSNEPAGDMILDESPDPHDTHCALCGDELTNDMDLDTGVCQGCAEVSR